MFTLTDASGIKAAWAIGDDEDGCYVLTQNPGEKLFTYSFERYANDLKGNLSLTGHYIVNTISNKRNEGFTHHFKGKIDPTVIKK